MRFSALRRTRPPVDALRGDVPVNTAGTVTPHTLRQLMLGNIWFGDD